MQGWLRGDSKWYLSIATRGYQGQWDSAMERDTNFFPVYPWLVRAVAMPLRLVCPNPVALAGLVVSDISFSLAMIALYALAHARWGEPVAVRTIALLCIFPYAYYFGATYPESVFLGCSILAFWYAEKGRWLAAGSWASVAGATKVPGFLVGVAVLVLYLEKLNFSLRQVRMDFLAAATAAALLPGLWLTALWWRFGNPLFFVGARGGTFSATPLDWRELAAVVAQPSSTGLRPVLDLLQLLIFLVALILTIVAWFKVGRAYALWAAGHLLVSTCGWPSMGRYASVVFPVFVAMARILPQRVVWCWACVSTLLLGVLVYLFVHGYPLP